jgi:hypothetical protein
MRRVTENGSRSPGIPIRVDECGSLNAVDSGANSALLVLLAHAATCESLGTNSTTAPEQARRNYPKSQVIRGAVASQPVVLAATAQVFHNIPYANQ